MIKINVKETDKILSVKVLGHANYSEKGTDIVCAGISSIVTTTINGILSIDNKAITYENKEGFISIENVKQDNVTNELLNNMLNMFSDLESKYPKNIQMKRG